mgnify:CR=1 FL=1
MTALQEGANERDEGCKDESFVADQRAVDKVGVREMRTWRRRTRASDGAGVRPFARQKACEKQAAEANQKAIRNGEIEDGAEAFNNWCLVVVSVFARLYA